MTANAFSSLSLDPPMVLVCVRTGAEEEPLSRYFSSKDRPRGRDAFREVAHTVGVTGSPILDGVVGYLDCALNASHTAGDHEIFVGEVLTLGSNADVAPLLFHGG